MPMLRFFTSIVCATIISFSPVAMSSSIQSGAFSLLLKLINKQLNGRLDADSLEFLPPFSFRFEKVRIYNHANLKILTADSIKGSFDLGALLKGSLSFSDIQAQGLNADIRITDGDFEIAELFSKPDKNKKPDEGSPTKISFKRIRLFDSRITLDVDRDFITQLEKVNLELGPFDTIAPDLNFKMLQAKVTATSIPLKTDITGKLRIRIPDSSAPSQIDFEGDVADFTALDFASISKGLLKANISFNDTDLQIKSAHIENSNLNLDAKGNYKLKSDELDVQASATIQDSRSLIPSLDPKLSFTGASLQTIITGKLAHPVLDLTGKGRLDKALVSGRAQIDTLTKKLSGKAQATSPQKDFSLKTLTGLDLYVTALTGTANLGGTLDRPILEGTLRFDKIFSSWLSLNEGSASFLLNGDSLFIRDGMVRGADEGVVKVPSLAMNLETKQLAGQCSIDKLDLAKAIPNDFSNSEAILNSTVQFAGTLSAPLIWIDGDIAGFTFLGETLGDFKILANYGHTKPNVFELSGALRGPQSDVELRGAIDTRLNQINTLLEIHELDAAFLAQRWANFRDSERTWMNGRVQVLGRLEAPNLQLELNLNSRSTNTLLDVVSAHVEAQTTQNHGLDILACLDAKERLQGEKCQPSEMLSLKGDGTFNGFDNFNLKYTGMLSGDNLEEISDFLARENILLTIKSEISGNVAKRPKKDFEYSLDAMVQEIKADIPDIPVISLKKPFELKWSKGQLALMPDATFSVADGNLSVGGNITKDTVFGHLEGKIPLVLARMINRNVVRGTGVALGEIKASGPIKAPSLNATLKPEKGSSIRLRWLSSDLEFESGEIRSTMLAEGGTHLHTVIENLRVRIGNGNAKVNGAFDLDFWSEDEQKVLRSIDVAVVGDDLSFAVPNLALEGDLNLVIRNSGSINRISGSAVISSGKFTQNFNLDNFRLEALTASAASDSTPPAFFRNFELDITADVSSLDLNSSLVAFDFSGNAAGNLKIEGNLFSPNISGIVELADGELEFPSVKLEIPSTVVKLRPASGKIIDPEIHLKAYGELSREEFNLREDAAIELSLDGGFSQMRLDLRAIGSDPRDNLDRSKLLFLLLGSTGTNPVSILLKPLSSGLQDWLSRYTATRIRVGSTMTDTGLTTRIQWRLNPRLELEGSSFFGAKSTGIQDAKFKLFLFDHLPIGRELFLEGIFFTPTAQEGDIQRTQTLKLTYRLFEQ